MLMNGNIEKNLKFFVGSCCEGNSSSFSFAMDKHVNRHEVDMIGFENGEELFAAEFKCTFSYDKTCTTKAAIDASSKVIKTFGLKKFKYSSKQIVHFLNHSRQNSESSLNPKWIKDKSPNTKVVQVEDLVNLYQRELEDKLKNYTIISYKFDCPDLGLEAVVVDL